MKITSLALTAVFAALIAPARAAGPYSFIKIADTSTPAPGLGTFIGTFDIDPAVDDGVVVFNSATSSGSSGVYTGSGGPVSLRINTGDMTPYGPLTSSPQAPDIDDGVISFWGAFAGGHAIFKKTVTADIVPIVRTGDPAPMGAFTDLYQSASISGGNVAVFGFYHYTGTTQTVGGIFVGDGTSLDTVAAFDQPPPPGSGLPPFRNFSVPTISDAGVALRTDFALHVANGGALTKIAQQGDPTVNGSFGGSIGGVAISGDTVAFAAGTSGGMAVFRGDGGPLVRIARAGQVAPGGIGTFVDLFYGTAISGSNVAFTSTYSSFSGFGSGIFLGDGASLSTLVKKGDSLFGGTVSEVRMGTNGFDEDGNIAFRYSLTNGVSGIALARRIPEPASAAIVAVALVLAAHPSARGPGQPSRRSFSEQLRQL